MGGKLHCPEKNQAPYPGGILCPTPREMPFPMGQEKTAKIHCPAAVRFHFRECPPEYFQDRFQDLLRNFAEPVFSAETFPDQVFPVETCSSQKRYLRSHSQVFPVHLVRPHPTESRDPASPVSQTKGDGVQQTYQKVAAKTMVKTMVKRNSVWVALVSLLVSPCCALPCAALRVRPARHAFHGDAHFALLAHAAARQHVLSRTGLSGRNVPGYLIESGAVVDPPTRSMSRTPALPR